MWPLLALLGVGLVVAAEASSGESGATSSGSAGFPTGGQLGGTSNLPTGASSSTSSSTTPVPTGSAGATPPPLLPLNPAALSPDTIEMSCDQAFALLPKEVQVPVATALLHGINVPALNALADQMDAVAETQSDPHLYAAFKVIAHCLRARATSVSIIPTQVGTQIPFAA